MHKKLPPLKYDESWKQVFTMSTIDAIKNFHPVLAATIDFTKQIEFLEQEIIKDNHNKKITDKLIKFELLNGVTQFIFVHIEIEANKPYTIAKRMFNYYIYLLNRFSKERILGLIIYVGDKLVKNINTYIIEDIGFRLEYVCHYYSFAEQKEADLLANENPIALIVLATKWANQAKIKGTMIRRIELAKKILLEGKRRGLNKINIRKLSEFISKLLSLSSENKNKILKENNFKNPIMYENIRTYQQAQEIFEGYVMMTEEGKPLSKYIEESKLEGKLEAIRINAKNFKKLGVDTKIIHQATGLSIKEIKNL